MTAIIAALWCLVCAGLIWRGELTLREWIAAWERIHGTPKGPQPIVIPDDIYALSMQHSEEWAREETMKLAREKFAEYGDWNKVRRSLGVGEMAA